MPAERSSRSGARGRSTSMTRTPPRRAVEVDPARALPAPSEIALFLDVDGTLLHIADTPDAVTIDRATVDLLARAHRATGGATALITGRRIADVDRLFAPLTASSAATLQARCTGMLSRFPSSPRCARGSRPSPPVIRAC
jgi:hypothetical protein